MKMSNKKYFGSVLILLLILNIPLPVQPESKIPEQVYSVTKVQMPDDWYKEQAGLWKKETDINPKNAEAWYNYYRANRYLFFDEIQEERLQMSRQEMLDSIFEDMGKAVPESYEYYVLEYCNNYSRERNISILEKAYRLINTY